MMIVLYNCSVTFEWFKILSPSFVQWTSTYCSQSLRRKCLECLGFQSEELSQPHLKWVSIGSLKTNFICSLSCTIWLPGSKKSFFVHAKHTKKNSFKRPNWTHYQIFSWEWNTSTNIVWYLILSWCIIVNGMKNFLWWSSFYQLKFKILLKVRFLSSCTRI